MNMTEMAKGYRGSIRLMNGRIALLKNELFSAPESERSRLEVRIYDLQRLVRETREVTVLLERYYEKGYYRNRKLIG